jgi:hypothetical protein
VPNPLTGYPSKESYVCSHLQSSGSDRWASARHRENTSSTQPSIKMAPATLARSYECESFFPPARSPRCHPARSLIQQAPNGLRFRYDGWG